MSEVITNIEVNFSSSGGSHSATVTTSNASSTCGSASLGSVIGKVGERSSFTKSEVDKLLKDFVLDETTTTKDSFGIKKSYKYIDSLSKFLDSWVVLCRGATAPVGTSDLSYDGVVYAHSEFPGVYKIKRKQPAVNVTGTGNRALSQDRIIILGKTYSVYSEMEGSKKIYLAYNKKSLVPSISYSNTALEKLDANKASLKYGYLVSDFFAALASVGLTITGAPSSDSILFDTSGTIRSCLSSIASFFGYYWYVDNKSIKFISSAESNSIQISNPTTDTNPKILSASFTEGGRTPRIVASFNGSTSSTPSSSSNSTIINTSGSGVQLIKKQLNRVDFDKLFSGLQSNLSSALIESFYSFFCSPHANSPESFDKLIYCSSCFYGAFNGGTYYPQKPKNKTSKKISDIVGTDTNAYKTSKTRSLLGDRASFFLLLDTGDKVMAKASETPLYTLLKGYYDTFGTVFISRGYSNKFVENATLISSDGATVDGPYKGNTKISQIGFFADIVTLLQSKGFTIPTVETLAGYAGMAKGANYFIAITKKQLMPEDSVDNFDDLSQKVDYFTYSNNPFIGVQDESVKTGLTKNLNSSKRLYSKALKNLKNHITLAKMDILPPDDEEDDQQDYEEEEEEIDYQQVYSQIKSQKPNDFSKSELKSYNASYSESKTLAANFTSLNGANPSAIKSSSVTYYDFKIPEEITIDIDSISLSVSSDGVSTTISKSNKAFLPPDQSNFLTNSNISITNTQAVSKIFSAGTKNFLKIN
jgi:GR25 family glycosyltransferase involved in LPS biosynthesis